MVILVQHSNNLSTGLSSGSDPAAGALSRSGHTAAAVVLGFILVLGFLGNFLVLVVFSRFPRLQTPVNLLLINISASDMLVCIFGTPLSFAASVRGRWLTGTYGCRWYGFSNALFGIVSLVSLSLLSFERYSVVLRRTQPDSSQYRRARLAVAASWLYSLVWTLPPLLGWSSYGPEGPGTTCSVQWHQRSATARSYISCLFIFCLLLPLLLMIFCYGRILLALRAVARQVSRLNRSSAERREGHVLLMVVSMVTGYLLCWMPYGVMAMLASFGRPGVVPPAASLIPSLLAKTSTILNPVIYVLLNNQFYRCFLYMIRCGSEDPPTPVHHPLPSRRGVWLHALNPPTEEQNTAAPMFTSREL
ncbi:pinopsin-like [Dicentrarchus labrax]|uniref:G-protein coupled receptors family 1 profile domain-containing protein n=1 Tax=Dicentrarchus labrax TaxID=13489 RepID=A0A8C4DBJ1_DICLA|nr:pinopsin-like [Dicentrarchus labrax]XP_051257626.1 pinopsin-like [Dicentrarchus labrax]